MAPRKSKPEIVVPAAVKTKVVPAETVMPPKAEAIVEANPAVVAEAIPGVTAEAMEGPEAELQQAVEAAVAQGAEIQENVRRLAEQTLAQTRDTYAQIRVAAEEATGSLEASYMAAANGVKQMQGAALQAFRDNAVATIELFKAMIAARDLADAVKLQSEHVTRQMEAVSSQVRDFGELAKKVGTETAEPLKSTFGRPFGVAA